MAPQIHQTLPAGLCSQIFVVLIFVLNFGVLGALAVQIRLENSIFIPIISCWEQVIAIQYSFT